MGCHVDLCLQLSGYCDQVSVCLGCFTKFSNNSRQARSGYASAKLIHPHEGPQQRQMWLYFKLGLFHCIKHWRGCLYSNVKKFYFKFLYSNTKTEPRKGGVAFLSKKSIKSSQEKILKDALLWEGLYTLKEIKQCDLADSISESLPFCTTFQASAQEE